MLQLTGIGLRPKHLNHFMAEKPNIPWLEVHSENFFGEGLWVSNLINIRKDYPLSLHGVSLSLGSSTPLDLKHLNKLKELIEIIDPFLISDHLSWSQLNHFYLHDLLPFPFTEETLNLIVARIDFVQDFLKRKILIENISRYIDFKESTISEAQFLNAIVKKSGCGILLDINNLYVNSINLNVDPLIYLNALPSDDIQEIHLAGYEAVLIDEQMTLIDSHNTKVSEAVWELYAQALKILGKKITLIEWDENLPSLTTLIQEAIKAETILGKSW